MFIVAGTIFFSKNWKFSAVSCFLISIICSLVYFYTITHRGLPKNEFFPERFVFLGVSVKEPDANSKGAIYYWIRPIPSDKDRTPLSIKVPYSEEEHRLAQEIQRRIQKNQNPQARRGNRQFGNQESDGEGFFQLGQIFSSKRKGDSKNSANGGAGSGSGGGGNSSLSGERNNNNQTQNLLRGINIPNYYFELIEPENLLPPKD
jgi:hypothetical protein